MNELDYQNKYILDNKEVDVSLPGCELSDVMCSLPTDKEAEKYANGYFGYPEDYEDSRVISASEQAFVSGCDWVRNEIERKLKGN